MSLMYIQHMFGLKRFSTGGEKGRHLWPRLVQKIAEGKTSYELSWKVKETIKKNTKKKRYVFVILVAAARDRHVHVGPAYVQLWCPWSASIKLQGQWVHSRSNTQCTRTRIYEYVLVPCTSSSTRYSYAARSITPYVRDTWYAICGTYLYPVYRSTRYSYTARSR